MRERPPLYDELMELAGTVRRFRERTLRGATTAIELNDLLINVDNHLQLAGRKLAGCIGDSECLSILLSQLRDATNGVPELLEFAATETESQSTAKEYLAKASAIREA